MKLLLRFFLMAALAVICIELASTGQANAAEKQIRKIDMAELEKMVSDTGEKIVLINFFASWCAPCRKEIPELKELRDSYPADKLEVLGISLDTNDNKLAKFAADSAFNYPIFQDKGNIAGALGIRSIPRTLVIGKDGKVEFDAEGLMTKADIIRVIKPLL